MPDSSRQPSRRATQRAARRRRDRRVRLVAALAALLVTGVVAALLAQFGATVLTPPLRAARPPEPADPGCGPRAIQSLDSWRLARVERDPVAAPEKRRWEAALGGPNAAQPAIRARMAGWPQTLLVDRTTLPRHPTEFAWRVARDTWRGLDALTDREHGLPLDTVRVGPQPGAGAEAHAGDYTSTTNIGLHMIDVVAALELGFIDRRAALDRISRTLDTLARLQTDNGFYFNYYDTTSLERTSHFVSFVDSAWLTAGLMVVRMTFPELYQYATLLIDQSDYAAMYDPVAGLMSHGYFVEPRAPSRYHYGVLYTEARLGALIAIGKGAAPASLWFTMTRTFPDDCHWQSLAPRGVRTKTILGTTFTAGYYEKAGLRYVPSWGGSMFEALMPTVVLDEASLAPRSLGANGTAHAIGQRRFARRTLHLPVWGFSPSATPGAEQYGEFGVKWLGSLGYPAGPVTPHASALALAVIPRSALHNLQTLASRYDVYGEYGFYDAVDPVSGQVAYKYLTLDQSMIFLALTNHLTNHAIQRRFADDPIVQRALPVIALEDFFD
ncbi:MAG: glucoamylase family protein [Candidatus Binatia bacterium]